MLFCNWRIDLSSFLFLFLSVIVSPNLLRLIRVLKREQRFLPNSSSDVGMYPVVFDISKSAFSTLVIITQMKKWSNSTPTETKTYSARDLRKFAKQYENTIQQEQSNRAYIFSLVVCQGWNDHIIDTHLRNICTMWNIGMM